MKANPRQTYRKGIKKVQSPMRVQSTGSNDPKPQTHGY